MKNKVKPIAYLYERGKFPKLSFCKLLLVGCENISFPKTQILVFFFLLQIANPVFSQTQSPINEQDVAKTIAKEEDLWYVNEAFPKDSLGQTIKAEMKKTKPKKKVPKLEREEAPHFLNIAPGVIFAIKWFFYALLMAGILLLIFKGNFTLPSSQVNTKITDSFTEKTTIENVDQLQNIGFEIQIAKAESEGNFRLAIRLYYLWALKKLVNLHLITFHIKKTNSDYCAEMAGNKHFNAFRLCTNYYNYAWFGEFVIEGNKYENIKAKFNEFISTI